MKEIASKLFARRLASLFRVTPSGRAGAILVPAAKPPDRNAVETSQAPNISPSGPAEPTACELCDTEWGAMTVDEIAELLVQSGRFPEEQRPALVSLPRERLVSVFCGCSASLRLAPPSPGASSAPRPVRR